MAASQEDEAASATVSESGHRVQLYSMQSHTYVHTLTFNSKVLSLRCSCHFLVVALDAQIHAFDATTWQHTFSAVTYSVFAAMRTVKAESSHNIASSPMALGSAWLAYASNQAGSSAAWHIRLIVCMYMLAQCMYMQPHSNKHHTKLAMCHADCQGTSPIRGDKSAQLAAPHKRVPYHM